MFVKYFVYSVFIFCAFGGVLKDGNPKKLKEIVYDLVLNLEPSELNTSL